MHKTEKAKFLLSLRRPASCSSSLDSEHTVISKEQLFREAESRGVRLKQNTRNLNWMLKLK